MSLTRTIQPPKTMSNVAQKVALFGKQTAVARAPLESLVSPSSTAGSSAISMSSKSDETETQEIDDESHFSTVPLTAPPAEEEVAEIAGGSQSGSSAGSNNIVQTPTTSLAPTVGSRGSDGKPHAKKQRPSSIQVVSPAPSVTSASIPNADFIIARLDKDLLSPTRPTRTSYDGKAILQTEFDNARKANQEDAPTTEIDWDFWGVVMADYESFARNEPKKLARAIEAGIPPALRGMLWQLMSASKDSELEQIYANLLKRTTPHEKAIARDLGRTFPHHAFFMDGHGIGQESLFNVLKAYSLFDPECGYCQGLPFVVAPLLLVCPDEEAFCLLVRLMQSYDLRAHYLPEMPGLQLRLFQFDRLIEEMLPVLHVHFLRQGVKSSMFGSQWFLTLFAYRFPLDLVFRIFDHVIATGIEAIFSFSVLLLQKNEQTLLRLNFDSILEFFRSSLLDCYTNEQELEDGEEGRMDVDAFIRDASKLKITPFQLDNYASEYQELRRAQTAHLVEMDALRHENRQLKARLKKVEESFAQVETEHCDIIKQLVMAKLEKEEYEVELVRFKLLYAELMHQTEDAGSSTNRLSSLSHMSANRKMPA